MPKGTPKAGRPTVLTPNLRHAINAKLRRRAEIPQLIAALKHEYRQLRTKGMAQALGMTECSLRHHLSRHGITLRELRRGDQL